MHNYVTVTVFWTTTQHTDTYEYMLAKEQQLATAMQQLTGYEHKILESAQLSATEFYTDLMCML